MSTALIKSCGAMMTGELHEVSVAIGKLEEGMRFLAKQVHSNQEVATEEHRKVHDIVVSMSESVRIIVRDIGEMKPLTDDYREKRAEARGAAKLAKVMYGGALAIGSAVGSGAAWLISMIMTAPKPH